MTAPLATATIGISHRKYWREFEGAPTLCAIYAQYPFKKMSVGLHFIQDKVGGWQQNMLQFSYAYQIRLGQRNAPRLSIGISAGQLWSTFNLPDIQATDIADPLAISAAHRSNAWLFSGGLYFTSINRRKDSYYPNRFYFFGGIAGKYALSAPAFSPSSSMEANRQRVLHANSILGIYCPIANDEFFIQPILRLDYTAHMLYSPALQVKIGKIDAYWALIRYRVQGDWAFQIGFNAKGFKENLPLQLALLFIPPSKKQKGDIGRGYGITIYYQMER